MCQMYFDRVNEEFLTNFRKILVYTVKKHLTYEICQRKFGGVRGALIPIQTLVPVLTLILILNLVPQRKFYPNPSFKKTQNIFVTHILCT